MKYSFEKCSLVLHLECQLSHQQKISKSFYPIKSLNSFLNILNISFSKIPNFTKIARRKWNTIVDFPKNDIMTIFFKHWKVNTIVLNYIQIITKYKTDARKWIVYSMNRLVDNLFTSCWWYESIKCMTTCIGNIIIAPFWAYSIKFHNKDRASRRFIVYMIHKSIQVCTKSFKHVLILIRWSVETNNEAIFIFQPNFSYQTVT